MRTVRATGAAEFGAPSGGATVAVVIEEILFRFRIGDRTGKVFAHIVPIFGDGRAQRE